MIHRNVWKKRSNIWWNQRLHRCLSLFTYLMKHNLSVAWSWTKKSLKTPALWTEFLECVHKKKGTLHVLCRYCHRSYAHPSKIGKDTADGNQNLNGPQHRCLDTSQNAIFIKRNSRSHSLRWLHFCQQMSHKLVKKICWVKSYDFLFRQIFRSMWPTIHISRS